MESRDQGVARGVHVKKARNNCKFKIVNIIMAILRTPTKFDEKKYGKAKSQLKAA